MVAVATDKSRVNCMCIDTNDYSCIITKDTFSQPKICMKLKIGKNNWRSGTYICSSRRYI
ncbi:hypothetical protein LguiA_029370 [Lonicera macranthoides]